MLGTLRLRVAASLPPLTAARQDQLDALDALFAAQAERDRDRTEFYRLFRAARRSL